MSENKANTECYCNILKRCFFLKGRSYSNKKDDTLSNHLLGCNVENDLIFAKF